jgi:phosphoribosylformimino-5-aminoimidazole carboxamide ribotide isomerase
VELIAAVDLLGGRGVRLRQGRYDDVVEAGDPVALGRRFVAAGVGRLHVVDLDGARAGEPRQTELLGKVVEAARASAPIVRIQAAGGLRTEAAVAGAIDVGADDVVLGTAAVERPGFLAGCAARWPGRVHAAIDTRDGRVALDGWERERGLAALDVAGRLLDEGAAGLIVTDTRRDGTLGGPNIGLLAAFRARFASAWLVAAGGVRSIDDLLALEAAGVDGAVAGLALVTGDLPIEAALRALRGSSAAGVTSGAGTGAASPS